MGTPYKHLVTHQLAIGSASVSTPALGSQTYAVRVASTGNCHIAFGPSPTAAAATSAYLAANTRAEFIGVSPGTKVAVIQDGTATGDLYVTELSH